jgi:enoyl-CoA hydratase
VTTPPAALDAGRYAQYLAEGVALDEPRAGVLRLRLTRPEMWNAMPLAFHDGLPGLFAEIAADRSVTAFVMAGSGRVFSSGGDVKEGMPERHTGELIELQRVAMRIITRLLEIPQPTICVVNGPAIGFAASLALHFDFIVAADHATFRDSHAAFGAAPGDGLALILQAALAPALAREVLYAGRVLSAEEAARFGLVNRVVPLERLEEEALDLLAQVQGMAPLAVLAGKTIVNAPLRAAAETVLSNAAAVEMITLASKDFRAAIDGFLSSGRFDQRWQGR